MLGNATPRMGVQTTKTRSHATTRLTTATALLALGLGAGVVALILRQPGSFYQNPWLHAAMEGYSQLIGLVLAAIFFGMFYFEGRRRDLLIAAAFLTTALIDLPHSLSYPGVVSYPGLRQDSSAYFWLLGRLSQAGLLLAGALARGESAPARRPRLIAGTVLASLLVTVAATALVLGLGPHLPVLVRQAGWTRPGAFVHQILGFRALTPLKVALEGMALLGFLTSLVLYQRQYRRQGDPLSGWLAVALVPLVYSEAFFMIYPAVYGVSWYTGHFLKVVSYLVLAVWLPVQSLRLQQLVIADRDELLGAYQEIGRLLTARLDLDDLLHAIVASAVRMTGATCGLVRLADGTIVCTSGCSGCQGHGCDQVVDAALQGGLQVRLAEGEPRAAAAVPLTVEGETLGAICVWRSTPEPFTDAQLGVLVPFAAQAAAGMQQARLYQQRLEEQERRERFISVVTHELKTPLTSIKGYAQHLLRSTAASPRERPRLQSNLETIVRQADRMSRLVDEVSDWGRVRSGSLRINKDRVELGKWLRSVVEHLRQAYPDRAISLEEPEQGLTADIDPDRLAQVVENLVVNAVTYSPEGAPVAVSLAHSPDRTTALLRVQDQGEGLPPEELERVFEPFYRSETSESYHRQGIGLGLYISRAITIAHGGELTAHSQPGQGSTFTVAVPLAS